MESGERSSHRPVRPAVFDVLGLALAGRPGTEQSVADLVEPWLAEAVAAADAVGIEARREDLRLGVAVSRGLLIDLLATGYLAGTTAANERFVETWESARTSAPPGP